MTDIAQIITSYGRHYIVCTSDGQVYDATARKKRIDFACGDQVRISPISGEQVVIEDYFPREGLLYRQDAWKTKLIAADVTRSLIVAAANPSLSETLLQRALLAAEMAGINAVIVLSKVDLPETAQWHGKLKFYETLGYPAVETNALEDADILHPILGGQINILPGQNDTGKSILTNALLGNQATQAGNIPTVFDPGKHTTTHAQLYDLNAETRLIDSPGLQESGLHHLQAAGLSQHFPGLHHFIGQCRFHNCTHRAEPDYAVKAAAESGGAKPKRIEFLQRATDKLLR